MMVITAKGLLMIFKVGVCKLQTLHEASDETYVTGMPVRDLGTGDTVQDTVFKHTCLTTSITPSFKLFSRLCFGFLCPTAEIVRLLK